jgi:hypothetical protein
MKWWTAVHLYTPLGRALVCLGRAEGWFTTKPPERFVVHVALYWLRMWLSGSTVQLARERLGLHGSRSLLLQACEVLVGVSRSSPRSHGGKRRCGESLHAVWRGLLVGDRSTSHGCWSGGARSRDPDRCVLGGG